MKKIIQLIIPALMISFSLVLAACQPGAATLPTTSPTPESTAVITQTSVPTATPTATAVAASDQSVAKVDTTVKEIPASQKATPQTPCGTSYIVRSGDTLRGIASKCDTSVDEILALNDFIFDRDIIYPGWVLDLVPANPDQSITIPETGAALISNAFYVVKAGDNLAYIARRLNLSVDDILTMNPQIDTSSDLYTGQILLLPGADEKPAAAVSPRVIEPGQLVTVVARNFPGNSEVLVAGGPLGQTEAVLKVLDTTKEGFIRATIAIPMNVERGRQWTFIVRSNDDPGMQARTNIVYVVDTTGPEESLVYSVRLNDTLSGIAFNFGISLDDLIAANPQIDNPSILYVGQDILIPGTK